MRRSRRAPIEQLRTAIDCLPLTTRVAMLEGVRSHDIIVGAYADRRGGVCPMLAAHRCGGRTSFISFARAWDTFAKAKRVRRADERELRILIAYLETSILRSEEATVELKEAIADHEQLVARGRPRPGDPDRSAELAGREGWAWLRPFRRWDDYERALATLERESSDETEGSEPSVSRELVG